MRRRCAWCGVFVAKDAELTAWRVPVGPGSRQIPKSKWNYWARLLCADCAKVTDVGCWERTTVANVVARRGKRAIR